MAFAQSVKATLKQKRQTARNKRASYYRSKKKTPIGDADRQRIREVLVELHQKLEFGPISLKRYIQLQRDWLSIGDSVKREAIDTVEKVVSQQARGSAALISEICKAWCQIAGVSFERFPVLEMRYHSRAMSKFMWKQSCFVRYTGQLFSDALTDVDGFDARWAENATLTMLACVIPIRERSLGQECFKTLKAEWRERGGSDADFRWLAKQSRSWLNQVFALTRDEARDIVPVLLKVTRLRLRLCHLQHPALRACVVREITVRHASGWREQLWFEALGRSFAAHTGPVRRFNPFRFEDHQNRDSYLQEFRNMGDWFDSLERSEEIDRLLQTATLESLKRRSDEWHEMVRRDARKRRRQLQFVREGITEWSEHDIRFEWLSSSGELADETEAMDHCVAGYDVDCFDQLYRVYRVTGRTVQGALVRATVGYQRACFESPWVFDQAQGPREQRLVDKEVETAARRLLRELNRDLAAKNVESFPEHRGDDTNFSLAA